MDKDKEIKQLEELVKELRERLLAFREITLQLMANPNKVFPDANRLLLKDYVDYLTIDGYMDEHNCQKITTHQLQRYVLKNRGFREIETMLWNLQKLGLLEISIGKDQYLVVSLIGSTVFKLQQKKNNRGE